MAHREMRTDAGENGNASAALSRQLAAEFGNGYSRPNLFRMILFPELFADREIVSTLSRQLSWSHFVEILQLKNQFQRDFYAEMCRLEHWSLRENA